MIQKTYLILLWIFRIKNIWLLSKCIFKHWLQFFFVFTFLRKSSWMSGKIASTCTIFSSHMGKITCASRSFSASTMAAAMLEPGVDTLAAFRARLFLSLLSLWDPFCSYGAGTAPEARRDPWKRWTGTIRSSRTRGSRSSPRFAWAFSRLILSAWRCNRGIRLQNCKWRSLILAKKKKFDNWPELMQESNKFENF